MKTVLCILSLLLVGVFSFDNQLMDVEEIKVIPSITVRLEGAVKKEGEYTFHEIISVKEMLYKIGVLEDADLTQIPLDQLISPELLLYVPYKKEGLISLNTGTYEQFLSINGIGPKKAQAIIEGRPYTCLEDLMNIKGIGEATYRKFRVYFCL